MESIIGFEKQKKYFERLIKESLLSHAYLFSGPEMIGKFNFALDLCRKANNRNFELSDPDLMILQPDREAEETKIKIETVREIKNFLSLSPYYGPYKFVVINNADRLTIDAANSLLKVLEEPNRNSVLILVTAYPKSLPATILSRCQTVRFTAQVDEIFKSNLTPEIKNHLKDFESLKDKTIAEKMAYAKNIYEKENYAELVRYWLFWEHSLENKKKLILKNLLELNLIVSQPQYNHKLVLENFLINL